MTDTLTIPGYKSGTWAIDPAHSEIGFSVRHMMISKVKGTFRVFEGTMTLPENPLEASVTATADTASVTTGDANRDGHLQSPDFFDAAQFPTISFTSTGVRQGGEGFLVDGDLTIKGVTKEVTFDLEFGGFGEDPFGNYKGGATATTKIDRKDFGLTWNNPLKEGGVLVGDEVTISLDLQAAHQA